ncbi:hypothetical protein HYU23_00070 [Candidatus Woesearchaeota archaeon]|nr:hypothetical protein [Candidatus Woesearchaeota archaeon]
MKKIMTLVVLALFIVSIFPVLASEDTDVKAEKQDRMKGLSEFGKEVSSIVKANVSVKMDRELAMKKHVELRTKFLETKEKFMLSKEAYVKAKVDFRAKHKEVKEACNNNSSEECNKRKDNFLKEDAKSYLLKTINTMERVLEKRKAKIEEVMAQTDNKASLETKLEAVNAKLEILAKYKVEVENATTKEEVKELAKKLRAEWKDVKEHLEESRGTVMSHKFSFATQRAESLEKKLEKTLDRLEQKGYDVSSVEPQFESFRMHIANAKNFVEQARVKFEAEGNTSAIVKEGHKLLVEAHKELKLAHEDLKKIVFSIKIKAGAEAESELEDLSENEAETEVEVSANASAS